ncbi:DUF1566 domain-containing protein, partial [Paraburkholderia tropica]|uniref:DUF1566 domain-containing protein n=1 Tax=Paraburkholderia tropica TaxID=92647 RepID=UPI0007EC3271
LPEIAAGELYVGAVIDKDGNGQHVILLPGDNDDASWQAQMDWAKSVGGDLPSRVEQAILWANHRDQFQKCAYWSNEQDDDPEFSGWAWCQFFGGGTQGGYDE